MAKLYKGTIQFNGRGEANIGVGHSTWREYKRYGSKNNEFIIPIANLGKVKNHYIEFDLDQKEYDEIKSGDRVIFLWAMPAASSSLKTPLGEKYSGLVEVKRQLLNFITYSAAKEGYSGELRTKANTIHVRESVIEWTAKTMTANLTSAAADEIRSKPIGNTGTQRPKQGTKEQTMAVMGHPNTNLEQTGFGTTNPDPRVLGPFFASNFMNLSSWVIGEKPSTAWNSGSWDLKPQIYSIWGSMLRFGSENWALRYDHLSNIHYGYLSAATGLPLTNAIKLAGVELLGNEEDPSDEWATVLGYNLYAKYKNGITGTQLWRELKRHRGKSRPNTFSAQGVRHKLWNIRPLSKERFNG